MTKNFWEIIDEDTFDLRDVIERFEELEELLLDEYNETMPEGMESDANSQCFIEWTKDNEEGDNRNEYDSIKKLLDDTRGYGGDEQWRGDWYPLTFIKDGQAFTDEMQRLVEECDIGLEHGKSLPSYIVINWEETADNLRVDYSSVEVDGKTFWYR